MRSFKARNVRLRPLLYVAAAALVAGGLTVGYRAARSSRSEGPLGLHVLEMDQEEEERPKAPGASAVELFAFNVRGNQDASGQIQSETTAAVDPLDPLHIVAGAMDRRTGATRAGTYISNDGGVSWSDVILPATAPYTNFGDPVIVFCADGSAYHLGIEYQSTSGPNRLALFKRPQGAGAWTGPLVVNSSAGFPFSTSRGWRATRRRVRSPAGSTYRGPMPTSLG